MNTTFYSLGVTFYELLTGLLPFTTTDPIELIYCHIAKQPSSAHSLNPHIPPVVSDTIAKLMAKNPEDRYQSALGLKHDLETCLRQSKETGKIDIFTLLEFRLNHEKRPSTAELITDLPKI